MTASGAARARVSQIDLLKALAIISVIVLHSVPHARLNQTFAVLHVWQAVPVFVVLMGVTAALSTSVSVSSYGDYLLRRAERLLPAWLLTFAVAGILMLLAPTRVPLAEPGVTLLWLLGVTPVGPLWGTYFLTLLLQVTFLTPVLVRLYRRGPKIFVACAFILNFTYEIAVAAMNLGGDAEYLASSFILGWLFAFALGLAIGDGVRNDRMPGWIAPAGLASGVYLLIVQITGETLPGAPSLGDFRNALSFPYAALLVMLGLRYVPPASERARLARTGAASYHVYLAQMIYFSLNADDALFGLLYLGGPNILTRMLATAVSVLALCWIGVSWSDAETGLLRRLRRKKSTAQSFKQATRADDRE